MFVPGSRTLTTRHDYCSCLLLDSVLCTSLAWDSGCFIEELRLLHADGSGRTLSPNAAGKGDQLFPALHMVLRVPPSHNPGGHPTPVCILGLGIICPDFLKVSFNFN